MTEFGSRLRWVSDTSAADWLRARMGGVTVGGASLVSGVLPSGFEAYARILHPATAREGTPVRWEEIASWSGQSMHPDVRFEELAAASSDTEDREKPWSIDPRDGEIPQELLRALCDVLATHTASEHAWFCVWDGWGNVNGGSTLIAIGVHESSPRPSRTPSHVTRSPMFPPEVLKGPKLRLPYRDYLMFEGPLAAATELGGWITYGPYERFETQCPNLFWPDDQAWCVASEIDFDFTLVGGTRDLIEDLHKHRLLEVLPARVNSVGTTASR